MKLRGAYWAVLSPSENTLVTAGVLVAGKAGIVFRAYPEFGAVEAEMNQKLGEAMGRGLKPDEVLDYYAERSNGVTFSVSRPVNVEAKSVSEAAEKLLTKAERSGA